MPDSIGNTLSTALPISLGTNIKTFADSVEFGDEDYYKFTLNKSSSFNLALTGLSANADVAILNASGAVVSVGGIPLQSLNQGSLIETINTILAPGDYFIRVFPGSPGNPTDPSNTTPATNYTLTVQSDTGVRTDLVWRNFSNGQNVIWGFEGTTSLSAYTPTTTITDTAWAISASADFDGNGVDDLYWRYFGTNNSLFPLGAGALWLLNSSKQISGYFNLPGPSNPNIIIGGAANFNGDTIPDLVYQDLVTGAVRIELLNSSYVASSTVSVGSPLANGWRIRSVGDFNSDNRADLLWHNSRTGENLVWLLDGTTFVSSVNLPTSAPLSIPQVAGDFNGDGRVDLFVRNFVTGANEVWLLDGTSRIGIVPSIPVGDLNWSASAPSSRILPLAQKDGAGNTLAASLNIGILNASGIYRDAITASDPNDYYRFSLNGLSRVDLNLTGLGGAPLTGNLDIQILNSSGGVVASSSNALVAPESLTNLSLASGTYYVRVFAGVAGAASPYELSLQANSPPVLVSSGPITVNESSSRTISSNLLLVTDANNSPIQLTYQLADAPNVANGSLLLNGAAISTGNLFTQQDINQGRLVYQQNGSEGALTDRFIFSVSDGQGGAIPNTTFSINTVPVNDLPVLVSFAPITVSEGFATTIGSSSLLVTDIEQAAPQIVYSLNSSPTKGTLLLNVLGGAQPLTLGNTFTQADIDGDKLSYQQNGSETYDPISGADTTGSDRFTFTATDGAGGFLVPAQRTFSISVLQVNDAPVLVTNTGTTVSTGASRTIAATLLRATDAELLTQVGQDSITFSVTGPPTQGTLFLNSTLANTFTQADLNAGRVSYVHNGTSTNSDRFTFTVSDGVNTIAPSTFEIFVLGVKSSPVLLTTNPSLIVNENERVTLSNAQLNISDSDSAPPFLRYTVGSLAPLNGQLAVAGSPISVGGIFTQDDINNGRVTYQQNGSETTRDAFTFTFTDESGNTTLLAPKTFSISVLPVNDLPILLTTNPQITVTEGGSVSFSSSLLNATDPDGLASQITYAVATAPSGGAISLSGTAVTSFTQADINSGLVRYQQNGSEASSDSFSFTITDQSGVAGDPAIFNINVVQVNDAPALSNNSSLTVAEGATIALNTSNLLITDNDGPGPLTYTLGNEPLRGVLRSGNTTLSAGGTFTQLELDSGQVFYINNGSEFTSDRFTFTASDGATSGLGAPGLIGLTTFSINVTQANDAPTIATNLGITLAEEGLVTLTKSILNATDPDNVSSQLTFNVSASPANGTLLKGGVAVNSFTQADIDGNLISYKHNGSETTTDNFVFDVTDTANAAAGIQTFAISVTPVNDAPKIVSNTGLAVDEGNTLIINDAALLITDPDGPAISPIYTLSTAPTRGSLLRDGTTLSSGQTFTQADISATLLTYVNNGSEVTSDRFTFTASDGSTGILPLSTFSLTVNPVNDAPTITVPTVTLLNVNEDTQFTFSGINRINATDPDSTPLTVTLSSEFGGTVGLGSTSGLVGLTGNNTGSISFSGTPSAVSGALNNLKYKGTQDFNGTEQITIQVTDGTTPATQIITMNVVAVNDTPLLTVPTATIVVGEDLPTTALNLSLNDVDSGDSPLLITLTAPNGTLTVNDNGLLSFINSTTNGSSSVTFTGLVADAQAALAGLVYQGNPNYVGSDRITVTVDDQGATGLSFGSSAVTKTINLNVTSINDKPTFTPSATSFTINESGSSTTAAPQVTVPGWATGISSGALNESGQALTFLVTGNDNPSLFQTAPSINPLTGALTYTPRADANGVANVTVTLRDNGGTLNGGINTSDPVVLTITIEPVNDAPTFTKGVNQTINEDAAAVTVNGWATNIRTGPTTTLANESTQSATFLVSTNNDSLFSVAPAIDPITGTLTYTAAQNAFGTAVVSVSLQDNGGTDNGGVDTSPVQLFTVVVRSVNDAPSFTPILASPLVEVLEDDVAQSIQIATDLSVGANETSQTLSFSVATASSNSNLFLSNARPTIDATTGLLTFQTAPNAFGSAVITATLRDNGGTANGGVDAALPYVFTINVLPVNDAPSFTKGSTQTVAEDSGIRTVPGFASNITAGPGEGSSQVVNFLVATDNPSLFLVPPTINPAGTLTYTSAPDANGTAVVTVQLADNGGVTPGAGQDTSAPQLFTIIVTPVNDKPTLTLPGIQTIQEDPLTPLVFSGANAIQFTDIDSGSSPVRVVLSVQQGTITLPQAAGLNVVGGTNGGSFVTFTGAIDDFVSAFTNVSYQPKANFSGTDRLIINISDQGATGSGPIVPALGTVTINVTSVNDDPVLQTNNTLTVGESSGIPTNVIISNSLLKSTDVDNTEAQISYVVGSTPTAGQLKIANGAGFITLAVGSRFTQADVTNNRLRYAQDGSEATSDSFTFQISDGGALLPAETFNIAILPFNDPPRALVNTGLTLSEGAGGEILDTLLLFTDVDNLSSAELVYTLESDLNAGELQFGGTPLSQGQTFTQEDIKNGLLIYQNNGSESPTDGFNFSVTDGNSTVLGSFNIAVTAVNDAPTIVSSGVLSLNEGSSRSLRSVLFTTDPDNLPSELRYTLQSQPIFGELRRGSLSLGTGTIFTQQDVSSSLITYQHNGSEQPADAFTFLVSDGASTPTSGIINIAVAPVNDAPILVTNLPLTLTAGTPATRQISTSILRATDNDNPADQVLFRLGSLPSAGEIRRNGIPLTTGQSFSQQDIISNIISYRYSGVGSSDGFQFTIVDSLGKVGGSGFFQIAFTS